MLLGGFLVNVKSGIELLTKGTSLIGLTTTSTTPVLLTIPSKTTESNVAVSSKLGSGVNSILPSSFKTTVPFTGLSTPTTLKLSPRSLLSNSLASMVTGVSSSVVIVS